MKKRIILVLFTLGLVTGCGSENTRPDDKPSGPEQQVEQRSKDRWEHLLAKDFFAAYEFSTPGYREVTPVDVHSVRLRSAPVKWNDARFEAVSCSTATKCTVSVMVDYSVGAIIRGVDGYDGQQRIEETWLFLEDNWYYLER